ncbi:hypothetical protein CBL_02608 [Carabus blaptoides fortunei]
MVSWCDGHKTNEMETRGHFSFNVLRSAQGTELTLLRGYYITRTLLLLDELQVPLTDTKNQQCVTYIYQVKIKESVRSKQIEPVGRAKEDICSLCQYFSNHSVSITGTERNIICDRMNLEIENTPERSPVSLRLTSLSHITLYTHTYDFAIDVFDASSSEEL